MCRQKDARMRRIWSRVFCPIGDLLAGEHLSRYHLAHSARADLCRRLRRIPEARASYEKALALARQEPRGPFSRQAAYGIDIKKFDPAVDFFPEPRL